MLTAKECANGVREAYGTFRSGLPSGRGFCYVAPNNETVTLAHMDTTQISCPEVGVSEPMYCERDAVEIGKNRTTGFYFEEVGQKISRAVVSVADLWNEGSAPAGQPPVTVELAVRIEMTEKGEGRVDFGSSPQGSDHSFMAMMLTVVNPEHIVFSRGGAGLLNWRSSGNSADDMVTLHRKYDNQVRRFFPTVVAGTNPPIRTGFVPINVTDPLMKNAMAKMANNLLINSMAKLEVDLKGEKTAIQKGMNELFVSIGNEVAMISALRERELSTTNYIDAVVGGGPGSLWIGNTVVRLMKYVTLGMSRDYLITNYQPSMGFDQSSSAWAAEVMHEPAGIVQLMNFKSDLNMLVPVFAAMDMAGTQILRSQKDWQMQRIPRSMRVYYTGKHSLQDLVAEFNQKKDEGKIRTMGDSNLISVAVEYEDLNFEYSEMVDSLILSGAVAANLTAFVDPWGNPVAAPRTRLTDYGQNMAMPATSLNPLVMPVMSWKNQMRRDTQLILTVDLSLMAINLRRINIDGNATKQFLQLVAASGRGRLTVPGGRTTSGSSTWQAMMNFADAARKEAPAKASPAGPSASGVTAKDVKTLSDGTETGEH